MHSGTVAGNDKVHFWYEAAFQGRQDGHLIEEVLQALFKVKRDILPVHKPFFYRFVDFGLFLQGFLFFLFGLSGFLLLWEVGSSLSRAYKSIAGAVQSLSMKSKQEPNERRQSMSAARTQSSLSLSTQRVSDSLARPSEYRRKKRIKDPKICGWFLADLPVEE